MIIHNTSNHTHIIDINNSSNSNSNNTAICHTKNCETKNL